MSRPSSTIDIERRRFLVAGCVGALAAAAAQLLPRGARAAPGDVARVLAELTGGAQPKTGRVRLGLPEVADHGGAVPLDIEVESPMTEADYVEAVHVFAEENPLPGVATFHFTPMSGRARASTRIRLAKSQQVVALARMSNGDLYIDRRSVRVTVGGCT
ncbi:MAG: thiosulfate oxidation carrier protein SoxY [Gammaproteobacteria bacterium]|nr:thiosulfate oxidation carrier protein SoxY [Gammaproteobacteria bacterium]